jgi:arylsulfatase A-like enzyme
MPKILILLFICSLQVYAVEAKSQKPNIIFLYADQMRNHAMASMGNKDVLTPHLDKLADSGLITTNAISNQPVCTPYKAMIMTGRYSHSTGVIHNDIKLPNAEVSLAEIVKKHGYKTGFIGKWHLAGHRRDPIKKENRQGWEYWAVRNCSHRHFDSRYWLNDDVKPTIKEGWEPTVQTDLAIEFVKKNKAKPFCLFVSVGAPHNPYKAPKKYTDLYKGKKISKRLNNSKDNEDVLREYYAMVTSVDDCIGRLMATLKEQGLTDNTIVCFSSDHGAMLGSQGHRLKQRPWEESINIPFIISYPNKIKASQRTDYLVSSVDVLPTFLGLCGIEIPKNIEGFDFSATFSGKSKSEPNAAFLFNVHSGAGPGCDWRGIRTKKWVYAFHKFGDWVMYDLENDPYQLKNLVHDQKYAKQKELLSKQLKNIRAKLGENIALKGQLPKEVVLPK